MSYQFPDHVTNREYLDSLCKNFGIASHAIDLIMTMEESLIKQLRYYWQLNSKEPSCHVPPYLVLFAEALSRKLEEQSEDYLPARKTREFILRLKPNMLPVSEFVVIFSHTLLKDILTPPHKAERRHVEEPLIVRKPMVLSQRESFDLESRFIELNDLPEPTSKTLSVDELEKRFDELREHAATTDSDAIRLPDEDSTPSLSELKAKLDALIMDELHADLALDSDNDTTLNSGLHTLRELILRDEVRHGRDKLYILMNADIAFLPSHKEALKLLYDTMITDSPSGVLQQLKVTIDFIKQDESVDEALALAEKIASTTEPLITFLDRYRISRPLPHLKAVADRVNDIIDKVKMAIYDASYAITADTTFQALSQLKAMLDYVYETLDKDKGSESSFLKKKIKVLNQSITPLYEKVISLSHSATDSALQALDLLEPLYGNLANGLPMEARVLQNMRFF